jgi:hypothetical protein
VFLFCSSLISITVDAGNPNYSSQDGVLYNKAQTILIQCPGGKSGDFSIPGSVTSIDTYAFANCTGLTSVTFPNSVTTIGMYTFSGCTGLTGVSIPDSVTSIGGWAFYACSSLTGAYFYGNAPTMGSNVFLNCSSGFTVYYLAGSTGFTNPWCPYAVDQCYPAEVFTLSSTTTTTQPTTTTSIASTTTTQPTTTTVSPTTTTTTIEPECTLTIENSLLPLRAGLFARLRRIVIMGTNSEWDRESQVTIDDIKTLIRRVKDQDTIIAWIIIPGKLIAKFEPGIKEVRVQTPGKGECTGEIVIE